MIYRDTVAAYVQENLEDTTSTFHTLDAVYDSIQDGYNLVSALTGCIPKIYDINAQSEPYYNLSSLINDFLYVIAIWDYEGKCWLESTNRRFLSMLRLDFELWTGNPKYFCPISFERTLIVPFPENIVGYRPMRVFYRAKAPNLATNDYLRLPAQQQNIVEQYSTADLLEVSREFSKAQTNWLEFQKSLKQINQSVFGLARAARNMTMQPNNPMPLFPGGEFS